jgi:photosystem II stability/assembly factor-like uncharacterized protein
MQIAKRLGGVALGLSLSVGLALGGSWTKVDNGVPRSPVGVRTLVVDPSSPSTVYALGFGWRGFGLGSLFKSTDGGATWTLTGGLSAVGALVINPSDSSNLYAIANGEVVKSADGGQNWTSTGLGLNSASALAIDPKATSTLYAITGNSIFKTTNGGASWSPKTSGLPASIQNGGDLLVDAANPSTIYVIIDGALYKSTDGGETWHRLVVGQFNDVSAVALDPAYPSTVYAALEDYEEFSDSFPTRLFKSTDGGETWSGVNNSIPETITSLLVDPTSAIYASYSVGYFASSGGVLKSTDGGASWAAINTGFPSNTPPIYSLALNPTNPSAIFGGYSDRWTGRGGVSKTMDGGANWNDASSGLAILAVHALVIDATDRATVYVAAGDGVSKTIDSGANWSTVHFSTSGGLGTAWVPSLLIAPNDPGVVYASAEGSNGCSVMEHFLRRSTDGGATWSDLAVQQCDSGAVSLTMAPSDSKRLYAAPQYPAGGTFLYQTSDGGANWNGTYIDVPVTTLVIDPANPAALYGGTARQSRGVIKSTDGGKTWADTALTDADVSALVLDPANSNILYAGTSVPYPDGTPGVFKTTDGGATWSAINKGLEGIIGTRTPITALVIDPKLSVLYLGTSGGGVFKSIDGGVNWTPFSDGLPSLDIQTLAVSSDGSGTVYAGTPGGVFSGVESQRGRRGKH